jgi:hypothetical protein
MAADDAVHELNSALRPHLPWQVSSAIAQRERLDAMRPVAPVIGEIPEHSSTGPKAWDRALEPMLKLLDRAGDYGIRSNIDPDTQKRFRTLWYRFGDRGMYGQRPVTATVVFTFGADPTHERSPKHAHAFVTRRGDIGSPPRRDVVMKLDHDHVRRPLRFVNFGDALHDELIDGWARQEPAQRALNVTYFDDHVLWGHVEPGWFLLRMSVLDAAEAIGVQCTLEKTEHAVAAAVARSAAERLTALVAPFSRAARCAVEADIRWLRASLMATTEFTARWKAPRGWQNVPEEAVTALVNPMAHKREGLPRATPIAEDVAVSAELARLRSSDRRGCEVWSSRLPEFANELRTRLLVIAEEARDALDLARREFARAEEAVVDAEGRGNRAQITRADHLRDAAADAVAMTEVFWQMREAWLCSCEAAVFDLRPRERLVAAIRAGRSAT